MRPCHFCIEVFQLCLLLPLLLLRSLFLFPELRKQKTKQVGKRERTTLRVIPRKELGRKRLDPSVRWSSALSFRAPLPGVSLRTRCGGLCLHAVSKFANGGGGGSSFILRELKNRTLRMGKTGGEGGERPHQRERGRRRTWQ